MIKRLEEIRREYHEVMNKRLALWDDFDAISMRRVRREILIVIFDVARTMRELRGEWSTRFAGFIRQVSV